jgi:alkanesulfonate monooxygenase SsuD/methylene tetrahydromethanopterin reductase-like flavin-dependent oxidoreductase (luciferase family)
VRTHLAEGARKAGRDPTQIEVTALLPASVGDTRVPALAALHPGIGDCCRFLVICDRASWLPRMR